MTIKLQMTGLSFQQTALFLSRVGKRGILGRGFPGILGILNSRSQYISFWEFPGNPRVFQKPLGIYSEYLANKGQK